METRSPLWQRHGVPLVALAAIVLLYGFTRMPRLSPAEQLRMAERFAFTESTLPELPGERHTVRAVHPSLQHLAGWISSVGAAVALADLDGDGLANDVCYVDTRLDQVVVAPVPDSGERFAAFALNPAPQPYDAATMAPMGCLPGDFNEDGRNDLLVYYWGRTPLLFLQREAAGAPAEASYLPREVVSYSQRWYTNAATRADFDGDGHVDLVLGNYFQDDCHLLDATDGGTERMQHSMSRARNAGRNRLLMWQSASSGDQPEVAFTETSGVLQDAAEYGWTLALGAADLDGDLLPELYVANDFGPDRLLHNRSQPGQPRFVEAVGQRGFATPRSKVLGRDSFKGMGVDFADVNGDGYLDIYVSNIAQEYALEENHFLWVSTGKPEQLAQGIAPYTDRSEELGVARTSWSWDSRLADFDNDGQVEAVQATGFVAGRTNRWPELHELAMGNDDLLRFPTSWPAFGPDEDLSGHRHNPFFVRSASGRFYDLAAELGLDREQVSRGIATADVDGDGDLDFAVANQWDSSRFYRNGCPHPGAFLGLNLQLPLAASPVTRVQPGMPAGDTPGRPAIGAEATVFLPDGRRLVAQVDGGNGHSGVRSPQLHFGLGALEPGTRLRTEIAWRDAQGKPHRQSLYFTPGWHTVQLGNVDLQATASNEHVLWDQPDRFGRS